MNGRGQERHFVRWGDIAYKVNTLQSRSYTYLGKTAGDCLRMLLPCEALAADVADNGGDDDQIHIRPAQKYGLGGAVSVSDGEQW